MSNRNKALGSALETRVVERARKRGLPASRQPGSGVFRDYPNDVVVGDLLIECKVRSAHPSLSDVLSWLYNVQDNAARLKAKGSQMRGGVVVYNTKGEKMPRVLLDLDLFLDLCAEASQKCVGTS